MHIFTLSSRSWISSSAKAMESTTMNPGVDGSDDPNSTRLPLLLNPVYARTKSTVFDELRNFRVCLKWCALDHSTAAGRAVSYAAFVALALLVPAATSLSVRAPPTASSSASSVSFHKLVQVPASSLAAISFLTLAAFFRRYGLRQLLFLGGALRDDTTFVRRCYARELDRSFRHLVYILLPSFSVELAHKILFFSTVSVAFPLSTVPSGVPWNSIAFVATLASWVYRTGVFLLVCVLFRLTCELQILRFEGFYKTFDEGDGSHCQAIFREHMRIKGQLLVTSHRYRIFILGCLVTISASQLGALTIVLASKSKKNFCNSGDVVVCSAVQLSGFFMCLLGAARITHRAQRVVSIASRWHMTLSSAADRKADPPTPAVAESGDISDSGSPEGSVGSSVPHAQASTFEGRHALVLYLQHNGGGITLFGFALDRGLLHTLFAFETTLVLWILSKVVVLS
ncbi:unnamed protein product [Musa textilis]